jgi:SAM-dependent methyltransferase
VIDHTETLDIGCGTRKQDAAAVGIDRSPNSAADIVWDLDRYPWPLESDRFSRVFMSHIIEHFEDAMKAMSEVHRVCKNGADVFIVTPHFSSHNSFQDPTHRRHLAVSSFEYFSGKDFASFAGSAVAFDNVETRLTFGGNFLLDNAGRLISAASMRWYERHAAWIFPAWDIHCQLRVRK